MNRQQRRLAAKQARANAEARAEAERKYELKELRLNNVMIEQFYTAAGLAMHEIYGFGQQRIGKVWNRMNELIFSIGEDPENFWRMKQQLKEQCDIEMSFTEE